MDDFAELWDYEQIAAREPERAAHLAAAPDWKDIAIMVSNALQSSFFNGTTRFGVDESGRNSNHLRVVLQFPIGEQLFDWFFNSRTGYRAQFRRGAYLGTAENAALIARLRDEFHSSNLVNIAARRLSSSFDDLGPITIRASDLLTSLDPSLSKVWFCGRRIGHTGGVEDLEVFRSTPDLTFRSGREAWRSICADDQNAWLDVKGAFLGDNGLYQPKTPIARGRDLESRGTA